MDIDEFQNSEWSFFWTFMGSIIFLIAWRYFNLVQDTQAKSTNPVNGEYNEKPRKKQPASELAKMLHTVFGLDHYPLYMLRWGINEINEIEDLFVQYLIKIQDQKEQLQRIYSLTQPFIGELSQPILLEEIFVDKIKFVAENPDLFDVYTDFEPFWTELSSGVFRFPLFRPEFCTRLQKHMKQVVDFASNNEELSHLLGRRALVFDWYGLGWLNDIVFERVVKPVSKMLLNQELDWRHSYVIGYNQEVQTGPARLKKLNPHTDDSEITINVGLGLSFTGGELVLFDQRVEHDENNSRPSLVLKPELGVAILHIGRYIHEVKEVISGTRLAWIMWCRDREGLRQETCACCWMNQRDDQKEKCVCGAYWN